MAIHVQRLLSPRHHNTSTPRLFSYAVIGILILAGAIYLPSIGGLAFSDDLILIGGQGIGGGERFADCFTHPFLGAYFRPMVSVSFFIERKLFNGNPFFYHQTNILIHVLTTGAL